MALRWKKNPRETGLAAVGAGPQGHTLRDGTKEYAHIYPSGGSWRGPLRGWYWVAGWGSGVPHKNTSDELVATVEEAKADAMAYVKAHLASEK